MAITKTREDQSIEIMFGAVDSDPMLNLRYVDIWDDPDDADLPVRKVVNQTLTKYLPADPNNMDAEQTLTDVSGYSQLIQDICGLIWTD